MTRLFIQDSHESTRLSILSTAIEKIDHSSASDDPFWQYQSAVKLLKQNDAKAASLAVEKFYPYSAVLRAMRETSEINRSQEVIFTALKSVAKRLFGKAVNIITSAKTNSPKAWIGMSIIASLGWDVILNLAMGSDGAAVGSGVSTAFRTKSIKAARDGLPKDATIPYKNNSFIAKSPTTVLSAGIITENIYTHLDSIKVLTQLLKDAKRAFKSEKAMMTWLKLLKSVSDGSTGDVYATDILYGNKAVLVYKSEGSELYRAEAIETEAGKEITTLVLPVNVQMDTIFDLGNDLHREVNKLNDTSDKLLNGIDEAVGLILKDEKAADKPDETLMIRAKLVQDICQTVYGTTMFTTHSLLRDVSALLLQIVTYLQKEAKKQEN